MNTRNRIQSLTTDDKETLLSKTFFALPDNPSNKNFSPSQIKKKGYEGFLVIFAYINNLITAINANVDLTNTDLNDVNTALTTLNNYFSSGKALKAIADEDGTSIKTYGKSLSHGLTGNGTQWTLAISLLDKLGNVLDTETQVFGSATNASAGLMSASDKAKVDAIVTDIATCLASAKSYSDALVLRPNLVSILREATTSLNGLMSASDKAHLDALYALLGADSDSDTIVNTINEVLAIFNQYPEGVNLANALSSKVDVNDIQNNLTSNETAKPLSAYQGKLLKEQFDDMYEDYHTTNVKITTEPNGVIALTFSDVCTSITDNNDGTINLVF